MADLPPTAPGAAEAAGRSTTGSAGEDTSVQVDIDTAEEGTGQASEMASHDPIPVYGDSACRYTVNIAGKKIPAYHAQGFKLDGEHEINDDVAPAPFAPFELFRRNYSAVPRDSIPFGDTDDTADTADELSAARSQLVEQLQALDPKALQDAIDRFNIASDAFAHSVSECQQGDEGIYSHGVPLTVKGRQLLYDDSRLANQGNSRSLIVRPGGGGTADFEARVDSGVPSLPFSVAWDEQGEFAWDDRFYEGLMESMASRIVTAVEDKLKDHDAPKQNSAGDGLVGAMEGVQLDDTAGTPTSNREPKPDNDKRSAQSSFAGQIAERAQLVKQYTDKAVKECLSDVEEGKLQVDPQRTFTLAAGRDIVATLEGTTRMRVAPLIELSGMTPRDVSFRNPALYEDQGAMDSVHRRVAAVDTSMPELLEAVETALTDVSRALQGKGREAFCSAASAWAMAAEQRLIAAVELDMEGEPPLEWHTEGSDPLVELNKYRCGATNMMLAESAIGTETAVRKAGSEAPRYLVLAERGAAQQYSIDRFRTASSVMYQAQPHKVIAQHQLRVSEEGFAPETQLVVYSTGGSDPQEPHEDTSGAGTASELHTEVHNTGTAREPDSRHVVRSLLSAVQDAMLTQATQHEGAQAGERATFVPQGTEPIKWDVRDWLVGEHDAITGKRAAAVGDVSDLINRGDILVGRTEMHSGRR